MSGLLRAFFGFLIAVFFVAQPVFASLSDIFVGIANDPTGKSLERHQQVQVLQGFVRGTKTQQEALSALKAWDVNLF